MKFCKKVLRVAVIIFLLVWGLVSVISICDNASKYRLADWIIVLVFTSVPYDIYIYVYCKKRKNNKLQTSEEEIKSELEKARALREEYENKLNEIQKICDMKVKLADEHATAVIANAKEVLKRTEQECATKIHITNEKIAQLINESKKTVEMLQGITTRQEKSVQGDSDIISDTYIESGNCIYRRDGKGISDEEIPTLISIGLKKSLQNKPDINFEEDELEFRFMEEHETESQKLCDKFEDLESQALSETNIDKKIELLKQTIDAFESAKRWHYNHSKGAKIYFQNSWEDFHNSHNESFSWVDSVKGELEYQIFKRDEVIPVILKKSETGFRQPDIYNEFPGTSKSLLRRIIDELAQQSEIIKTKKGSSYFITRNS